MKTSFKARLKQQVSWWSFASYIMAIFTMFLLRDWLGIPSQPFGVHAGWRPFAGWVLMLAMLLACYDHLLSIFRTNNRPPQDRDLYTRAQMEIALERELKAGGAGRDDSK